MTDTTTATDEKRSIRLKAFLTEPKKQRNAVLEALKKATTDDTKATARKGVVLGMIVGYVTMTRQVPLQLPGGGTWPQTLCVGEFEATVNADKSSLTSTACYFPDDYADEIAAVLDKDKSASLAVAVEISLVPSEDGKDAVFAAREIMREQPDNPLVALKVKLAAQQTQAAPAAPKAAEPEKAPAKK